MYRLKVKKEFSVTQTTNIPLYVYSISKQTLLFVTKLKNQQKEYTYNNIIRQMELHKMVIMFQSNQKLIACFLSIIGALEMSLGV